MYTGISGWLQAIWMPIDGMLHSFLVYVPNLVLALLVLFFGGVIARVVSQVLVTVFHYIKFDDLIKSVGLGKLLTTGGVKGELSGVIGLMVHWVLMLGVLASALNLLGVGIAGTLLTNVLLYLPGVLSAMFVLIIGIVMAKFVTTLVILVAKNVHFEEHHMVSSIVKYAIIVFTVMLALEQLSISQTVIHEMLMYLFAAICLGFAIAYGIRRGVGSKDVDITKLLQF